MITSMTPSSFSIEGILWKTCLKKAIRMASCLELDSLFSRSITSDLKSVLCIYYRI